MPNMKTVDADVIAGAIADLTAGEPLFRSQPEVERYMKAIERIAEQIGVGVPWKAAEG